MRASQGVLHLLGALTLALSLVWLYGAAWNWTRGGTADTWVGPVQFVVAMPGITCLFAAYFTAEKERWKRALDWLEASLATLAVWLLLVGLPL